jgi:hypothetical protein
MAIETWFSFLDGVRAASLCPSGGTIGICREVGSENPDLRPAARRGRASNRSWSKSPVDARGRPDLDHGDARVPIDTGATWRQPVLFACNDKDKS